MTGLGCIRASRKEPPPKLEEFQGRETILMYPQLPKIELFARKARAGWAAWSNEVAMAEHAADIPTAHDYAGEGVLGE
jgi:N6-adenosine-specific RNA methylase IME4